MPAIQLTYIDFLTRITLPVEVMFSVGHAAEPDRGLYLPVTKMASSLNANAPKSTIRQDIAIMGAARAMLDSGRVLIPK